MDDEFTIDREPFSPAEQVFLKNLPSLIFIGDGFDPPNSSHCERQHNSMDVRGFVDLPSDKN